MVQIEKEAKQRSVHTPALWFVLFGGRLMGGVKPIKKGFDGIEVGAGNLDEDRDPVRHSPIP